MNRLSLIDFFAMCYFFATAVAIKELGP